MTGRGTIKTGKRAAAIILSIVTFMAQTAFAGDMEVCEQAGEKAVYAAETATASEEGLAAAEDMTAASEEIVTGLDAARLGSLTLTENDGYEEGAYLEWKEYEGASYYRAYISPVDTAEVNENTEWTLLDDELIRGYSDYVRVDTLGLVPGEYFIKVQALDSKDEVIAEAVSAGLTVTSYDRSGFAWSNGRTASGAYAEDGSLLENAVVVYVNGENYSSVKATLTNASGKTKEAEGLSAILSSYPSYCKYPLDIRIVGEVKNAAQYLLQGANGSVTIEGVGEDATINGGGFCFKSSYGVELRNVGIMNASYGENDDIGLDSCTNIWVHNCDLFYGKKGGDNDLDQVKGDGALDSKKSDYVTFSYNHFWDNGKASLLGSGSSETSSYGKHVTYHHNWFDHSDERNPRVRYFTVHIYNNYFDGVAKYGSGSTLKSSLFVENNYYRNVKYPMMTSSQGSDMYAGGRVYDYNNRNFSGEAGGVIKAYGNRFCGEYTFIPYSSESGSSYVHNGQVLTYDLQDTTAARDYDAVVTSSAKEEISSDISSREGGNTYNNFDTAATMYSYTADPAMEVPEIVMEKAGRLSGGDFWWNFTDGDDDRDNGRIDALSKALDEYVGSLVYEGSQTKTSMSSHEDKEYIRYVRNPLSNTNGKVYDENAQLIESGEDQLAKADGRSRDKFSSADFIKEALSINEVSDSDRDCEDKSSGFVSLENYCIPANSLNQLKLSRDTGILRVTAKNKCSLVIEAGSDQMEIHCDVVLKDADGNEIKERSGLNEIMHRAATTLHYELPQAGTYSFGYLYSEAPKDSKGNDFGSIRVYTATLVTEDEAFVNTDERYEAEHTKLPENSEKTPDDDIKPLSVSDNYVKGKLKTISVRAVSGNSASENTVVINAGVKLVIEGLEKAEAISINDISENLGTIKKNGSKKPSFKGGSIAKGVLRTKVVKGVGEQIYDIEAGDISLRVQVLNLGFDKAVKKLSISSNQPQIITLSSNGAENIIEDTTWQAGSGKQTLEKGVRTEIRKNKKPDSPVIAYVTLSENGISIKAEAVAGCKGSLKINTVLHGRKYNTSVKLSGN